MGGTGNVRAKNGARRDNRILTSWTRSRGMVSIGMFYRKVTHTGVFYSGQSSRNTQQLLARAVNSEQQAQQCGRDMHAPGAELRLPTAAVSLCIFVTIMCCLRRSEFLPNN